MEELTKQIEENKKIKQQLKQKQDQVKGMELELQERKKKRSLDRKKITKY